MRVMVACPINVWMRVSMMVATYRMAVIVTVRVVIGSTKTMGMLGFCFDFLLFDCGLL